MADDNKYEGMTEEEIAAAKAAEAANKGSNTPTPDEEAKPVIFSYKRKKYQFVGTHVKRAGVPIPVEDLVDDKEFCKALVESNSIIIKEA